MSEEDEGEFIPPHYCTECGTNLPHDEDSNCEVV